jgi:hypothetical protein
MGQILGPTGHERLGRIAILDAITLASLGFWTANRVMLRLVAALLLLVWSSQALPQQSSAAKFGRHADQVGYNDPESPPSRHAITPGELACDDDVPGGVPCTEIKDWQGVAWLKAKILWNFLFGTAERAIAVFTGLLALFSVLLWIYTKRAANAARRAAEHIPAVERAYLFATPAYIGANQDRTETMIEITVDNPGRTPGILTSIYGQFSQKPPKGDVPHYNGGGSYPFELAVNSSNGDPRARVVLPVVFKTDFAEQQFFWGYIEYLDIFKRSHTSRFCCAIFPAESRWQIAGGRGWNDWT